MSQLLSNPLDTFNYHQQLQSSKNEKSRLESELNDIQKLVDGYRNTKDALLEQHTRNIITTDELETKVKLLEANHIRNTEQLRQIESALAGFEVSEGYNKVFNIFQEKYLSNLADTFKDRSKTQQLLRLLIKEIIVSSRKVTAKDKLAGRKKENQEIPYKILIKLRLPQEILKDLFQELNEDEKSHVKVMAESTGLGANVHKWYPGRDSNPHALRATDFKSAVSTIPPPGRCVGILATIPYPEQFLLPLLSLFYSH